MTGERDPATADELWMDRAVARIWKLIWAIGAGGAVALLAWRGWWWGAGWLIGTAVSALNFRWLKQLVDGIGGGGGAPRQTGVLGMRLALVGRGRLFYIEIFGNQPAGRTFGPVCLGCGGYSRNPPRTGVCTKRNCGSLSCSTIILPALATR